jgi:hypothetical protein
MRNVDAFIAAGGNAEWDFLVFRHNEHQVDAARALALGMGFTLFNAKATSRFFDLSSYDDVRANADGIYSRLADGSMPCYGAWPGENVQRFRAWMEGGFAP